MRLLSRATPLAWLPLPVLLVVMAALWLVRPTGVYESALALLIQNLIFATLVSLFIAILAARSFLARGDPASLMLGCAMTIWGASAFVASAGGHVGNYNITIHNLGVLASALCHLAGAISLFGAARPSNKPGGWLAFGYSASLICVGLIWLATLENWLPLFFVDQEGGTPLRTAVLTLSIVALGSTAVLMWLRQRRTPSAFLRWYSLGLALLATGAVGLMLQSAHGGVLGWTARITQDLGGLYMVTGALLAVREAGTWDIRLSAALAEAKDQFELLFQSINDGVILHEATAEWDSTKLFRTNDVVCNMLGYTEEELRNVSPLQLFGPGHAAILGGTGTGSGHARMREMLLSARDGSTVPVEISTRVFKHGGRSMALSIIRDISERKQSESALTRQAGLLDLSFDAIFVRDAESRITYWNRGAIEAYGYSPEEAIGQVSHILLQTQYPEFMEVIMNSLRQTGRWQGELVHMRKDGTQITTLSRWSLDPKSQEILETSTNVTEQKRRNEALRESEKRFRALADSSPLLIWVCDPDGTNQFVNRAYAEYFGVTPDQALAANWQPPVHPDDVDEYAKTLRASMQARKPWLAQARMRRASGEWRWIESRTNPRFSSSGSFIGVVGSGVDVTEQKRHEEELREADRNKDRFLATLAHELRNPLAPIRTSLEIMQHASGDPAMLEQARSTMERQISHMVRLIDDLLDISRITRNRLELRRECVELGPIVHHAVDAIMPTAQARNLAVNVTLPPEPVYLNADPVRLAQIMGNLLANACKYTETDGRIWLTANRQAGEIVLSIKDDGIGIPPDMLDRVFDMFTQVEPSIERTQGGLGLGLSIVKTLVELHDGTVTARSEGTGTGSEFVVRLPVLAAGEQPPAAMLTSGRGVAMPTSRILVVDDNRDAAAALSLLLRLQGNQTETADDGIEALEKAAVYQPDVILLDIGLPKLNGYDVCRKLREQRWGKRIIIIALTGWGQEHDRRKSSEAGFNGHLVKPVDFDQLTRCLETAWSAYTANGGVPA